VVKGAGLEEALTDDERSETTADVVLKAEELAKDLESMGPIWIKLGQVLSSRGDLLPQPYLDALSRLHDSLEPFPYAEIETIIQDELGVRMSKAFRSFDPDPIGVASLGQVHRAELRDGRAVVVKVQRPGIRPRIATDFEALEEIARFADNNTDIGRRYKFSDILAEFRKNLIRELDYRLEADNLRTMRESLTDFDRIFVPAPINDYTTSKVLTMDYVAGRKISDLSPLTRMETDTDELADQLFKAYLKNIVVDGMFHADPHPGNVLLTDDRRIGLIDLGMIGRVTPEMQDDLLKLLIAGSEGRAEEAANVAIKIGEALEDFDEPAFRRQVTELIMHGRSARMEDVRVGSVMMDLSRISGSHGLRLPTELTMLGKTLLNLDEVGRILAPHASPNEAIRRHASDLVRQKMMQGLNPGRMLNTVMETREFVDELPGRVNRILDAVAQNRLKINVDAIDEDTLIDGFQKVANRIATGLVLGSLIIGASLLMRVQTSFMILGYPGLAMVCFTVAAGLGFWLILSIMLNDRNTNAKGSSSSK
jgi:predicted unusual protein kinase regulating ubiquinone biosynthesis (AarF/ABC1/UbiB family)